MGSPWSDHRSFAVVGEISRATGRDVAHLLTEADAETLRATRNAQLAAFTLSMVILDAARNSGLSGEAALAGHSLGEYSALVAAGALSLHQGATLVAARGNAMQHAADHQRGTMAAVLGMDPTRLAEICDGIDGVWVANDNAPGQVVVAGTAEGVALAGEAARASGAKRVMALAVGGAFHTPLMAGAQADLNAALAGSSFAASTAPVVANVDASLHFDGWSDLLAAQLTSPVRWRESLTSLAALGVDHFVELGPGTELSGMVKRTVEGATRACVATPAELEELVQVAAPRSSSRS